MGGIILRRNKMHARAGTDELPIPVFNIISIIKRAGVVPMSIAGIAKEVTTIIVSAWFFGDELTPLNITGVGITICGTSPTTFTFGSSCFL